MGSPIEAVDQSAVTPNLRARSSSGTMWTAASLALGKGIVFLSTLVLARLLDPTVFGLFGIGLLVVGYLEFLNDFGIGPAVINLSANDRRLESVAFWLNIALGVALTTVTWLLAPAVAAFFDEPSATGIVRGLSFVFLLRSVGAVHAALLKRDLMMKQVTIPEVAKALIKAIITIALAFAGFGVWSLVWGQLAGAAVGSILFWVVSPWRPSLISSLAGSRRLLAFGSQITVVGLLGSFNKNVDYLFVGRSISTAALGVYTLAFRLPQLLIESINTVVGQVAFPVFSQLQRDRAKGRLALRTMLRVSAAIVVPVSLGLFVTAGPVIEIFYGDKWLDAIEPMRYLALAMLAIGLTKNIGDVHKGYGRPGLLNAIGVARLLITVPLLVFAVRHGLTAVSIAVAVSAAVVAVVTLVVASRVIDIPMSELLGSYRTPAIGGLALLATTWPVLLASEQWLSVVRLGAVTATGAAAYVGALWLIDRSLVIETASLVRVGIGRTGETEGRQVNNEAST